MEDPNKIVSSACTSNEKATTSMVIIPSNLVLPGCDTALSSSEKEKGTEPKSSITSNCPKFDDDLRERIMPDDDSLLKGDINNDSTNISDIEARPNQNKAIASDLSLEVETNKTHKSYSSESTQEENITLHQNDNVAFDSGLDLEKEKDSTEKSKPTKSRLEKEANLIQSEANEIVTKPSKESKVDGPDNLPQIKEYSTRSLRIKQEKEDEPPEMLGSAKEEAMLGSTKEEAEDEEGETWCAVCHDGGDLLYCCDRCPKVYHLYCYIPPLEEEPPDDWVRQFVTYLIINKFL